MGAAQTLLLPSPWSHHGGEEGSGCALPHRDMLLQPAGVGG